MQKIIIISLSLINIILAEIPEIFLLKTKESVQIDGKLEETCWLKKIELTQEKSKEKTYFSFCYDDEKLYLGVVYYPIDKKESIKKDTNSIDNDYIEILFYPSLNEENFYKIKISFSGIILDTWHILGKEKTSWNIDIEVKTCLTKNSWIIEAAFPFKNFEISPWVTPCWGVNFIRKNFIKEEEYKWAETKFGFLKDIKINFSRYILSNMKDKIYILKKEITDQTLEEQINILEREVENLTNKSNPAEFTFFWNKLEEIIITNKRKLKAKTEKYQTPHVEWAKNYYQGEIHLLFIIPESYSREVYEFEQRFSTMKCDFISPLSKNLPKLLQEGKYDTIIIASIGKDYIEENNQSLIAQLVKKNCGLVYINPYRTIPELASLLPVNKVGKKNKEGKWQKRINHFITSGIPFIIFPKTPYVSYKTTDTVIATVGNEPLIIISKDIIGQSRVVVLTFNEKYGKGLLPSSLASTSYSYWEYYYSLLGKIVLWASKKEPAITILKLESSQQEFIKEDLEKIKIELILENKADLFKGIIYISLKDEFGQEEKVRLEKVRLDQGKGKIEFPLPSSLNYGWHFVDIKIMQKEKVINWGTTVFKIKRNERIKEIILNKENFKENEKIEGKILLYENEKAHSISISIKDIWKRKRVIFEKELKLKEKEINFSFFVKNLTILNYIEAEIFDKEKNSISKLSKEFIISKKNFWEDYKVIMWLSDQYKHLPLYLRAYYFKRLNEIGCTTLMDYQGKYEPKCFIESNLDFFIENIAHIGVGGFNDVNFSKETYKTLIEDYQETKDESLLIREPCLNDPKVLNNIKERIEELIRTRQIYSPLFYSIGDECSITYLKRTFDFCFSEFCLKAFQNWLKTQYKTIKALNQQWDENFSSWEEIKPHTFEQIIKKEKGKKYPNYSSWADHRSFMEDVFVNTIDKFRQYIKAIDKEAKVGILGGQSPSCYGGYNWWKLMKVLDVVEAYNIGGTKEIIRSFNKENKTYILSSEFGEFGNHIIQNRFYNLFHQDKGIVLFSDPQYINFDFTLTQAGEALKENLPIFKNGMASLFFHLKREKPKIAIHYSQASIYSFWIKNPILQEETPPYESILDKARIGAIKLIEDLKLQYDFISYEEIENGGLKDYTILVMPSSVAISLKEKLAIEEFTKTGGMVIADGEIALMDEHCKTYPSGLLDNLFGIKRKEETLELPKEEISSEIKITSKFEEIDFKDLILKVAPVEFNLELQEKAKALGNSNGIPCLIINRYGKGKTLYLNFSFSYYRKIRHIDEEASQIREIFSKIFLLQDITSEIKISSDGKEIPNCEVIIFKQKELKYLVIIKDYFFYKTQDALNNIVFMPKNKDLENGLKNVIIELKEKKYVYDIKEAKAYGETQIIRTNFDLTGVKVFALLPYELKEIEFKFKSSCKQGEKIDYEIELIPTKEKVGLHIINLTVFDPKGEECKYYTKNILIKEGIYKDSWEWAFNEKIGSFRFVLKDLTTGKEIEKKIEVLKR